MTRVCRLRIVGVMLRQLLRELRAFKINTLPHSPVGTVCQDCEHSVVALEKRLSNGRT
jgi:hypothetical protein